MQHYLETHSEDRAAGFQIVSEELTRFENFPPIAACQDMQAQIQALNLAMIQRFEQIFDQLEDDFPYRTYNMDLSPAKANQAYMNVSALEAGHLAGVPLNLILAGAGPYEVMTCPSLAFILQHSKLGKRVLFDLGIRRDFGAYPPAVLDLIKERDDDKPSIRVLPGQAVDESLIKGGTSPDQIDTVIISHLHWDHLGDPGLFTKATFVVGEECKSLLETGYPTNPESHFATDALPAGRTCFLSRSDFDTPIGPFPHALDYFGDGSMYVIDTPGHLPGHVNVLARTSPDGAWIHLGGDTAHHSCLLTGEGQVAYSVNAGAVRCVHVNKEVAEESIRRLGKLLGIPKVQVLIAHDFNWYNANKGGDAFFPGTISPLT